MEMDLLEKSRVAALRLLGSIPKNAEMDLANIDDPEIWMGAGFLVGTGQAFYRGDNHFRLSSRGWRSFEFLSIEYPSPTLREVDR